MTYKQKLDEIKELCDFRLYHVADKRIDEIYEDYSSGRIWLSQQESEYMFLLLNRISHELYG